MGKRELDRCVKAVFFILIMICSGIPFEAKDVSAATPTTVAAACPIGYTSSGCDTRYTGDSMCSTSITDDFGFGVQGGYIYGKCPDGCTCMSEEDYKVGICCKKKGGGGPVTTKTTCYKCEATTTPCKDSTGSFIFQGKKITQYYGQLKSQVFDGSTCPQGWYNSKSFVKTNGPNNCCGPFCGDFQVDKKFGEECDGRRLDPKKPETFLGYGCGAGNSDNPNLPCGDDCKCGLCGNNKIDAGEPCELDFAKDPMHKCGYTNTADLGKDCKKVDNKCQCVEPQKPEPECKQLPDPAVKDLNPDVKNLGALSCPEVKPRESPKPPEPPEPGKHITLEEVGVKGLVVQDYRSGSPVDVEVEYIKIHNPTKLYLSLADIYITDGNYYTGNERIMPAPVDETSQIASLLNANPEQVACSSKCGCGNTKCGGLPTGAAVETVTSSLGKCCSPQDPFVCGSDNKTYTNKCEAEKENVKVLHEGECRFAMGDQYYKLPTDDFEAGGGDWADFHAEFPAMLIPPNQSIVLALTGSENYRKVYGKNPDIELFEDGVGLDKIPEMKEAFPNSIDKSIPGFLDNRGETLVMYRWNHNEVVVDSRQEYILKYRWNGTAFEPVKLPAMYYSPDLVKDVDIFTWQTTGTQPEIENLPREPSIPPEALEVPQEPPTPGILFLDRQTQTVIPKTEQVPAEPAQPGETVLSPAEPNAPGILSITGTAITEAALAPQTAYSKTCPENSVETQEKLPPEPSEPGALTGILELDQITEISGEGGVTCPDLNLESMPICAGTVKELTDPISGCQLHPECAQGNEPEMGVETGPSPEQVDKTYIVQESAFYEKDTPVAQQRIKGFDWKEFPDAPTNCPYDLEPVCGGDGKTYQNMCFANSVGAMVLHFGDCNITQNLEEKACSNIYLPVCGEDGFTYSNGCFPKVVGVKIKHNGFCTEEESAEIKALEYQKPIDIICPLSKEEFCDEDGKIYLNSCYAVATGLNASDITACGTNISPESCTEEYNPVCGTEANTYQNACFAQTANAIIAHAGACTEEEISGEKPLPVLAGTVIAGGITGSAVITGAVVAESPVPTEPTGIVNAQIPALGPIVYRRTQQSQDGDIGERYEKYTNGVILYVDKEGIPFSNDETSEPMDFTWWTGGQIASTPDEICNLYGNSLSGNPPSIKNSKGQVLYLKGCKQPEVAEEAAEPEEEKPEIPAAEKAVDAQLSNLFCYVVGASTAANSVAKEDFSISAKESNTLPEYFVNLYKPYVAEHKMFEFLSAASAIEAKIPDVYKEDIEDQFAALKPIGESMNEDWELYNDAAKLMQLPVAEFANRNNDANDVFTTAAGLVGDAKQIANDLNIQPAGPGQVQDFANKESALSKAAQKATDARQDFEQEYAAEIQSRTLPQYLVNTYLELRTKESNAVTALNNFRASASDEIGLAAMNNAESEFNDLRGAYDSKFNDAVSNMKMAVPANAKDLEDIFAGKKGTDLQQEAYKELSARKTALGIAILKKETALTQGIRAYPLITQGYFDSLNKKTGEVVEKINEGLVPSNADRAKNICPPDQAFQRTGWASVKAPGYEDELRGPSSPKSVTPPTAPTAEPGQRMAPSPEQFTKYSINSRALLRAVLDKIGSLKEENKKLSDEIALLQLGSDAAKQFENEKNALRGARDAATQNAKGIIDERKKLTTEQQKTLAEIEQKLADPALTPQQKTALEAQRNEMLPKLADYEGKIKEINVLGQEIAGITEQLKTATPEEKAALKQELQELSDRRQFIGETIGDAGYTNLLVSKSGIESQIFQVKVMIAKAETEAERQELEKFNSELQSQLGIVNSAVTEGDTLYNTQLQYLDGKMVEAQSAVGIKQLSTGINDLRKQISDLSSQLKTATDEQKQALQDQITDLQKQVAGKELEIKEKQKLIQDKTGGMFDNNEEMLKLTKEVRDSPILSPEEKTFFTEQVNALQKQVNIERAVRTSWTDLDGGIAALEELLKNTDGLYDQDELNGIQVQLNEFKTQKAQQLADEKNFDVALDMLQAIRDSYEALGLTDRIGEIDLLMNQVEKAKKYDADSKIYNDIVKLAEANDWETVKRALEDLLDDPKLEDSLREAAQRLLGQANLQVDYASLKNIIDTKLNTKQYAAGLQMLDDLSAQVLARLEALPFDSEERKQLEDLLSQIGIQKQMWTGLSYLDKDNLNSLNMAKQEFEGLMHVEGLTDGQRQFIQSRLDFIGGVIDDVELAKTGGLKQERVSLLGKIDTLNAQIKDVNTKLQKAKADGKDTYYLEQQLNNLQSQLSPLTMEKLTLEGRLVRGIRYMDDDEKVQLENDAYVLAVGAWGEKQKAYNNLKTAIAEGKAEGDIALLRSIYETTLNAYNAANFDYKNFEVVDFSRLSAEDRKNALASSRKDMLNNRGYVIDYSTRAEKGLFNLLNDDEELEIQKLQYELNGADELYMRLKREDKRLTLLQGNPALAKDPIYLAQKVEFDIMQEEIAFSKNELSTWQKYDKEHYSYLDMVGNGVWGWFGSETVGTQTYSLEMEAATQNMQLRAAQYVATMDSIGSGKRTYDNLDDVNRNLALALKARANSLDFKANEKMNEFVGFVDSTVGSADSSVIVPSWMGGVAGLYGGMTGGEFLSMFTMSAARGIKWGIGSMLQEAVGQTSVRDEANEFLKQFSQANKDVNAIKNFADLLERGVISATNYGKISKAEFIESSLSKIQGVNLGLTPQERASMSEGEVMQRIRNVYFDSQYGQKVLDVSMRKTKLSEDAVKENILKGIMHMMNYDWNSVQSASKTDIVKSNWVYENTQVVDGKQVTTYDAMVFSGGTDRAGLSTEAMQSMVDEPTWAKILAPSAAEFMLMQGGSLAFSAAGKALGALGKYAISGTGNLIDAAAGAAAASQTVLGRTVYSSLKVGAQVLYGTEVAASWALKGLTSPFALSNKLEGMAGVVTDRINILAGRTFGTGAMFAAKTVNNIIKFEIFELAVEEVGYGAAFGAIGLKGISDGLGAQGLGGAFGDSFGDVSEMLYGAATGRAKLSTMSQVFTQKGVYGYSTVSNVNTAVQDLVAMGTLQSRFAPISTVEVEGKVVAEIINVKGPDGNTIKFEMLADPASGVIEGARITREGGASSYMAKSGSSFDSYMSSYGVVETDNEFLATDAKLTIPVSRVEAGTPMEIVAESIAASGAAVVEVNPAYVQFVENGVTKIVAQDGISFEGASLRVNGAPVTVQKSGTLQSELEQIIKENIDTNQALKNAVEKEKLTLWDIISKKQDIELFMPSTYSAMTQDAAVKVLAENIAVTMQTKNVAESLDALAQAGIFKQDFTPASLARDSLVETFIVSNLFKMKSSAINQVEMMQRDASQLENMLKEPAMTSEFVYAELNNLLAGGLITQQAYDKAISHLEAAPTARDGIMDSVEDLESRINIMESVALGANPESIVRNWQIIRLLTLDPYGTTIFPETMDVEERATEKLSETKEDMSASMRQRFGDALSRIDAAVTGEEDIIARDNLAVTMAGIFEDAYQVSDSLSRDDLTHAKSYQAGVVAEGLQISKDIAEKGVSKRTVAYAEFKGLKTANSDVGHEAGTALIQKGLELTQQYFSDAGLDVNIFRGPSGSFVISGDASVLTADVLQKAQSEIEQLLTFYITPMSDGKFDGSLRMGVATVEKETVSLSPEFAAQEFLAAYKKAASSAQFQKAADMQISEAFTPLLGAEQANLLAADFPEGFKVSDLIEILNKRGEENFKRIIATIPGVNVEQAAALVKTLAQKSLIYENLALTEEQAAIFTREYKNYIPPEVMPGTLFYVYGKLENYYTKTVALADIVKQVSTQAGGLSAGQIESLKTAMNEFIESYNEIYAISQKPTRFETTDMLNFKAGFNLMKNNLAQGTPFIVARGDFDFIGQFFKQFAPAIGDDKYGMLFDRISDVIGTYKERGVGVTLVKSSSGDEFALVMETDNPAQAKEIMDAVKEGINQLSQQEEWIFDRTNIVYEQMGIPAEKGGLSVTIGSNLQVVDQAAMDGNPRALDDAWEQADALATLRKFVSGKDTAGGALTEAEATSAWKMLWAYNNVVPYDEFTKGRKPSPAEVKILATAFSMISDNYKYETLYNGLTQNEDEVQKKATRDDLLKLQSELKEKLGIDLEAESMAPYSLESVVPVAPVKETPVDGPGLTYEEFEGGVADARRSVKCSECNVPQMNMIAEIAKLAASGKPTIKQKNALIAWQNIFAMAQQNKDPITRVRNLLAQWNSAGIEENILNVLKERLNPGSMQTINVQRATAQNNLLPSISVERGEVITRPAALKVGMKVIVQRSSGAYEDDWTILSIKGNDVDVVKTINGKPVYKPATVGAVKAMNKYQIGQVVALNLPNMQELSMGWEVTGITENGEYLLEKIMNGQALVASATREQLDTWNIIPGVLALPEDSYEINNFDRESARKQLAGIVDLNGNRVLTDERIEQILGEVWPVFMQIEWEEKILDYGVAYNLRSDLMEYLLAKKFEGAFGVQSLSSFNSEIASFKSELAQKSAAELEAILQEREAGMTPLKQVYEGKNVKVIQGARSIAVQGDVHGDLGDLKLQLEAAGIIDVEGNLLMKSGDVLVFTGDYVDRGFESAEVVDFIMNMKKSAQAIGAEIITNMGNHDQIFYSVFKEYADTGQFAVTEEERLHMLDVLDRSAAAAVTQGLSQESVDRIKAVKQHMENKQTGWEFVAKFGMITETRWNPEWVGDGMATALDFVTKYGSMENMQNAGVVDFFLSLNQMAIVDNYVLVHGSLPGALASSKTFDVIEEMYNNILASGDMNSVYEYISDWTGGDQTLTQEAASLRSLFFEAIAQKLGISAEKLKLVVGHDPTFGVGRVEAYPDVFYVDGGLTPTYRQRYGESHPGILDLKYGSMAVEKPLIDTVVELTPTDAEINDVSSILDSANAKNERFIEAIEAEIQNRQAPPILAEPAAPALIPANIVSLNKEWPTLVGTIPGLTTELEDRFRTGGSVYVMGKYQLIDGKTVRVGEQYVIDNRINGGQTMDIRPTPNGVVDYNAYTEWKKKEGIKPLTLEQAKQERDKLKTLLAKNNIELEIGNTREQRALSEDQTLLKYGGAIKIANELFSKIPSSLLMTGALKKLNIGALPTRLYSGSAQYSQWNEGTLEMYDFVSQNGAPQRLYAGLLMHELGHMVEHTDPNLLQKMAPLYEAISNADAFYGVEFLGESQSRIEYQGTIEEFMAENFMMYTVAGESLRNHINSITDAKAKAAYAEIYNMYKNILGTEFSEGPSNTEITQPEVQKETTLQPDSSVKVSDSLSNRIVSILSKPLLSIADFIQKKTPEQDDQCKAGSISCSIPVPTAMYEVSVENSVEYVATHASAIKVIENIDATTFRDSLVDTNIPAQDIVDAANIPEKRAALLMANNIDLNLFAVSLIKPTLQAMEKYETPLQGENFVYHQTYASSLGTIYNSGGLAAEREVLAELDSLVDSQLPSHLQGFSRASSIYAQVDSNLVAATGRFDTDVVLKVKAGGLNAIVANNEMMGGINEIFQRTDLTEQDKRDAIAERAREYWQSAVPLSDFGEYVPDYPGGYAYRTAADETMFFPEVLIQGNVPNNLIQIATYPAAIQDLFDDLEVDTATQALGLLTPQNQEMLQKFQTAAAKFATYSALEDARAVGIESAGYDTALAEFQTAEAQLPTDYLDNPYAYLGLGNPQPVSALVEKIKAQAAQGKVLVVLDGKPGTGKSTLANNLVQQLGGITAKVIHTDVTRSPAGFIASDFYEGAQVVIVEGTYVTNSEGGDISKIQGILQKSYLISDTLGVVHGVVQVGDEKLRQDAVVKRFELGSGANPQFLNDPTQRKAFLFNVDVNARQGADIVVDNTQVISDFVNGVAQINPANIAAGTSVSGNNVVVSDAVANGLAALNGNSNEQNAQLVARETPEEDDSCKAGSITCTIPVPTAAYEKSVENAVSNIAVNNILTKYNIGEIDAKTAAIELARVSGDLAQADAFLSGQDTNYDLFIMNYKKDRFIERANAVEKANLDDYLVLYNTAESLKTEARSKLAGAQWSPVVQDLYAFQQQLKTKAKEIAEQWAADIAAKVNALPDAILYPQYEEIESQRAGLSHAVTDLPRYGVLDSAYAGSVFEKLDSLSLVLQRKLSSEYSAEVNRLAKEIDEFKTSFDTYVAGMSLEEMNAAYKKYESLVDELKKNIGPAIQKDPSLTGAYADMLLAALSFKTDMLATLEKRTAGIKNIELINPIYDTLGGLELNLLDIAFPLAPGHIAKIVDLAYEPYIFGASANIAVNDFIVSASRKLGVSIEKVGQAYLNIKAARETLMEQLHLKSKKTLTDLTDNRFVHTVFDRFSENADLESKLNINVYSEAKLDIARAGGLYSPLTKTIYLGHTFKEVTSYVDSTLLHEMCHYAWDTRLTESQRQQWLDYIKKAHPGYLEQIAKDPLYTQNTEEGLANEALAYMFDSLETSFLTNKYDVKIREQDVAFMKDLGLITQEELDGFVNKLSQDIEVIIQFEFNDIVSRIGTVTDSARLDAWLGDLATIESKINERITNAGMKSDLMQTVETLRALVNSKKQTLDAELAAAKTELMQKYGIEDAQLTGLLMQINNAEALSGQARLDALDRIDLLNYMPEIGDPNMKVFESLLGEIKTLREGTTALQQALAEEPVSAESVA